MTEYQLGDRVMLVYRNFDLVTDKFLGMVQIAGTVTRVWSWGNTISIRTDDGKTFMRNQNSPEVRHLV